MRISLFTVICDRFEVWKQSAELNATPFNNKGAVDGPAPTRFGRIANAA
ncbi:MAG: hypothetical protein MUE68_05985 [Bacteroidetes bacterium]|nr:hypothetical protein [Bacteroidota bacterium]